MKLLRRFVVLLIATAYIGAASVGPMVYADTPDMSSGMTHEHDGPCNKMPCKGMQHGCFSEVGCIFLVSVPTPDVNLFTTAIWSSVSYIDAAEALRGRTIKPDLGPPISHA